MGSSLVHDRLLAIIQTQNEMGSADLDSRELMTLAAARARALTGADAAVAELAEGKEIVGAGFTAPHLNLNAGLSRLRVRHDEVMHCPDARTDPRVDRDAAARAGVVSIESVPLRHRGQVLGALKLYSRGARAFDEDDVRTLELLAGLLATQLAELRAVERRRAESAKDALTGLPNRRAFEERLGAEVARIRRHGGNLALCLVDVDRFQAINDTLGRGVGDEVLRGVARNLAQVRGEDEAFRRDADEFALIFCEVDATGARIAASRLATAIQGDRGCGGVTVTWGIAELEGGDPAALVAQAEEALDQAKRAGSV